MLTELYHRISYLLGRRRFEDDLDDEVRFHLETRAEELAAKGMPASKARAQARREFGSTARMQEETRGAWQFHWAEDLIADLRYAVRGIRRNPGFAVTAITCLALGIGANTTIFSVASAALFSRPSVRDPQSLRAIRIGGMSHAPMEHYRFLRDAGVFNGLAGENEEMQANWRSGDTTVRLYTVQVTGNFFEVTGTPLAMGRGIQPDDRDTAVVSWRFWRQRLAADPDVLGRKLVLDGRPFTVIGVLPQRHRTLLGRGFAPELYVPVSSDSAMVSLYARIAPGMTQTVAISRLKAACAELDRLSPPRRGKRADNLRIGEVEGVGRLLGEPGILPVAAFFAMLMVVVTLVLLIACANVASLLLARASSRSQELAIRLSIGAGKGRVVRQLLAESLLLGLCGAAAGVALNLFLGSLLANVELPLPIPVRIETQPDWRLLAYAAAIAIGSSLVAGLAPAFQGARAGLAATLKRDERQVAGAAWSLRNLLVAGQLAVSIVLLAGGTIFLRNLSEASTANPGFDLDHTLWASARLVPEAYTAPEKLASFSDTALTAIRASAGVDNAALVRIVPMNDEVDIGAPVRTDSQPSPVTVTWYQNEVSPGYFRTLSISLVAGREFQPSDRNAAIVNENFARRLFGGANPIGRTFESEPTGSLVVVGVAKNSSYLSFSDRAALAVYIPYGQPKLPGQHPSELNFLVRAAGTPESIAASVRSALDRLDPTAAIQVRSMRSSLTFALLPSQAGALVLGSVGLLGLGLASVGLYGVLLYTVSRRIREIGLRVALGASPAEILKLVVRQSLGLVGAGLLAGTALSILAVRPLAMFLIPNVSPTDPLNFVAVGAVLCVVALLATVAPAIRALRVDPLTALRHE